MNKTLVIVESPAKAKTIVKYLGKGYQVKASLGHVRDLPSYKLGIDIANNFEPIYANMRDKAKIIKELKATAEKIDSVLIATDPDREGEAIAWHIQESTEIPKKKIKRIVFHEITKSAIQEAIKHCREIDLNLVNAQQARRVLDRLIGYKLSPILGKKIRKGLSAGRVQSVALKLICDREKEINSFNAKEYWNLDVFLKKADNPNIFSARLFAEKNEKTKLEIPNQEKANHYQALLKDASFTVETIKINQQNKNPAPPFITSTLQQEASRRFNWGAKKTMLIAQQLYEGIDVDGDSLGLITYMRTDSFRISNEAISAAKELIRSRFGDRYVPDKPRIYKSKKNAQDAHEAIRPAYIDKHPSDLEGKLSADQLKLYRLIWQRLVASQMKSSVIESKQIIISAKKGAAEPLFLKSIDNTLLFDGYTKLYSEWIEEKTDTDESELSKKHLPPLEEKKSLLYEDLKSEQKFTQPPARFSEASLVRDLEERGIGRPSTYAPTLSLIQDRGYVLKEKKILSPTDLGLVVDEQLNKYFSKIIDYNFTADMETRLDEVMEGKHIWQDIIADFYKPFSELLVVAENEMEKIKQDRPSDQICEKCSKPMVIKTGRFGDFLACSDYPNCKSTKSIKVEIQVDCPECKSPLLERRSKKGKVFYGCSAFPKCKFASWNKPIAQECPKCHYSIMVQKKSRKDPDGTIVCLKCGN